MSEILVEEVESSDERWICLCQRSNQATPFIYPDYLNAVGFQSKNLIASRAGIVLAGLCLPQNISTGKFTCSVPFSPYQGFIFPCTETENYGTCRLRFELATLLIELACKLFSDIMFNNHWSVKDIRSISWHNYHTPEKGVFRTNVAYSAVKDISTEEKIWNGLSSGRKEDFKKSKNKFQVSYFHTDSTDELNIFLELYRLTFARQNIYSEEEKLEEVSNIIKTAMFNSYGRMFYASTPTGKRIAAAFILFDKCCAYYIFGVNHPDYRNYGASSYLLMEVMQFMQSKGIAFFDFVGANSPHRGDFKLSFGAELMPYYCSTFIK